MQASLEKLQKFFRLEAEKGFSDQAIIGGLARVLDTWKAEAHVEGVSEEIIQSVTQCLQGYRSLNPEARAEALRGLWKQIKGRGTLGGAPAGAPAPAESREPRPAQKKSPRPERQPSQRTSPSGRAEAFPGGVTSQRPVALNASLTVLSRVGPRHAQTLARLGLHTLGDMLYFFPRRYDDYSQLKPIQRLWYGDEVTVVGTVQSAINRPVRGGAFNITEVVIHDGTGALRLTWFNQPWIANRLHVGDAISVSGRIDQYLGRLVVNNPDWEPVETENLHTNRIVPIYPLTGNVTQKWLRRLMNEVVTYWAPRLTDHLPVSIREAEQLADLNTALLQAHFPDTQESLRLARQRLAFDEIFFLQMGVLRQKRDWQNAAARTFEAPDDWLEARTRHLPYTLTGAQTRALSDLRADLGSGRPMNRLLQGDVGSGKTVVAALAASIIARSGAQVAFMAPTSILAEQHYRSLMSIIADGDALPQSAIRLLLGDTPDNEKEEIRQSLANGEIKVIIGTHALLEDPIAFADLQMVVIDEQHRFGVEQRALLRSKGTNPHLLVMTATPIPRSLALTIYGDLDISVMDEMPAGRQAVATFVLTPQERERAYSLIQSQVSEGHQAFIVYPLIEESEKSDKPAATVDHARLQDEVFPGLHVGLLHGRMRPEEKEKTMQRFRQGEHHILVSTTVIEVGMDIPNATVMLIEGANHFGLAQLHQLRGRVGRGMAQAYCMLIPDHEDAVENQRLAAMVETNDGFVLAERDLDQRGPGEFLGTRQSGYGGLRMANLTDIKLIEKARLQAQALFERDPDLNLPENRLLAEALNRFWGGGKGDVS